MTDALIAASGVRRSCETAERSAVRSSFGGGERAGRRRLRLELLELDRGGELARRRRRARAGPRCEAAAPASDEDVLVVEVDREARGRPGSPGTRSPVAASMRQPPSRAVEDGGAVEPETRRSVVEQGRRPAPIPRAAPSASASARARCALGGAARGERDEAAHDRRDGEEDDEREDVLAVARS